MEEYLRERWRAEEGLPQNTVTAILESRDGYLWLGTREGLVRFDGSRLAVLDRRVVPAFRTNHVRSLLEARDGALWVGTEAGVVRRHGGAWQRVAEDRLGAASITTLEEGEDGAVWLGTKAAGLWRWRAGELSSITAGDGLASDEVRSLLPAAGGTVWVGTGQGLCRVEGRRATCPWPGHPVAGGRVVALARSRAGGLWVGSGSGLARLEGETFTATWLEGPLSRAGADSLVESEDGTLWIGTYHGLMRLRRGRLDVLPPLEGADPVPVRALRADRDGCLWLGTEGAGLERLRDGLFTPEGEPVAATSVLRDRSGATWIGATNAGLIRLKDGASRRYRTADGLPSDDVGAMAEDAAGVLWVEADLRLARRVGERFVEAGRSAGLPERSAVRSLLGTRDGRLCVGTSRHGLFCGRGRLQPVAKDDLPVRPVLVILEDRGGTLWIGTEGEGVWRVGTDGRAAPARGAEALAREKVMALVEDEDDGSMWIGTEGAGLHRWRAGSLSSFTTALGLHDDVVYQILDDRLGFLWLTSNRGVARVRKEDLAAVAEGRLPRLPALAFGVADGMRSAECGGGFHPAGWRGRDGFLWIPTLRGLIRVDPAKAEAPSPPPPVAIEAIRAGDGSFEGPATVTLEPRQRQVELRYTAFDHLGPARLAFRYRLAGQDRDWVQAGTRREAFYTNLAAGTFQFEVQASRDGTTWSAPARATLHLAPRLDERPGVRLLAALVALALAPSWYALRLRRMRRREAELTARVEEALSQVKVLKGLLRVCAWCRRIRSESGNWEQMEMYVQRHSHADFTHGMCPDCAAKLEAGSEDRAPRAP